MHVITRTSTRLALALGTAALFGVTGCGGSSQSDSGPSSSAASTATVTATQTQSSSDTAPGQATTPSSGGQRVVPVDAKPATLKNGDLSMTMKVDKVADPLVTAVDRPRPGNKLVGVFVTGSATGEYEPTRTLASAALKTDAGTVRSVRVISDGDCTGAFFPGAILASEKPVSGCIGFEVPKQATPKAITITLASSKDAHSATWSLPSAS